MCTGHVHLLIGLPTGVNVAHAAMSTQLAEAAKSVAVMFQPSRFEQPRPWTSEQAAIALDAIASAPYHAVPVLDMERLLGKVGTRTCLAYTRGLRSCQLCLASVCDRMRVFKLGPRHPVCFCDL